MLHMLKYRPMTETNWGATLCTKRYAHLPFWPIRHESKENIRVGMDIARRSGAEETDKDRG